MPAKKFAAQMLNGTTWNYIMEGKPNHDTTITVCLSNHTQADVKVSLAITASVSASVPDQDIFKLNQIVYREDSREFPGIVIEAGQQLAARSESAGVNILVYGYEEEQ